MKLHPLSVALFLLLFSILPGKANTLLDPQGNPFPDFCFLMEALGVSSNKSPREFNDYLQNHFLRHSTEERWEMRSSPYEKYWEKALPFFERLGFVSPIFPERGDYDYVLFNGQSIPMMRKQLDFICRLQSQGLMFKKAFFLCSDRPLNEKIDGSDPIYEHVSTESEAARLLIREFLPNVVTEVISVPCEPATRRRPNTRNTVNAFLDRNVPPGMALIVSNNPFIPYQYETFFNAFIDGGWFQRGGGLDCCGDSIVHSYHAPNRMAVMLDNLARVMYTEIQRFGE